MPLGSSTSALNASIPAAYLGLPLQIEYIFNPINGSYYPQVSAQGAPGVQAMDTESQKATYAYATSSFTPPATPTDVLEIIGAANTVTRIKRISVFGLATANANASGPVQLIRRSTIDTGTVSTTLTVVKHDFADGAALSTVKLWSQLVTQGTTTGVAHTQRLTYGQTIAPSTSAAGVIWDFTTRNEKAFILRGTTDSLVINLAGATLPTGATLDIDILFTEEPSTI